MFLDNCSLAQKTRREKKWGCLIFFRFLKKYSEKTKNTFPPFFPPRALILFLLLDYLVKKIYKYIFCISRNAENIAENAKTI